MALISHDSWNSSSPVPHYTPLKSAEYLTDPAVIRAYEKLSEPPEDGIRFIRRISRNLHFSIWLRSVAWFCSLMFVIAFSFNAIVQLDFRMKSLIYPQSTVVSDDEEEADSPSKMLAIQAEQEERVASEQPPVIR